MSDNKESQYKNTSRQMYAMNEKELDARINETINEIGHEFYKINPLNKRISKSLRENFYKNENDTIQLNTNFDEIEEFEYEIDEFLYYFQIVKEKIAKARLMKTILLEKQSKSQ